MNDSLFVVLIPAILLIILAAFYRKYSGSWLEPGAYFALVWSFYTVLPIIVKPDYKIWAGAVWWILFSVFSVCCGSFIISVITSLSGRKHKIRSIVIKSHNLTRYIDLTKLKNIVIISISLGLIYSIITIWSSGRSLTVFLSIEDYILMAHDFSLTRYSQDYVPPPFFTQVFLIGVYSSPMLGGILYVLRRSKFHFILVLLSLLPSLVVFATQTTRAAFVLAFILWCSGYFSCKVLVKGRNVHIFTRKTIFATLWLMLLMVMLFAIGQVVREGKMPGIYIISNVLLSPNMRASVFGHVSAFSDWFSESWYIYQRPTFGAFTFAGFFDLLGLHSRIAGLYIDKIIEVEPGGFTNIFTIFRGLIQDFTLIGSLVFLFIIGTISSWAYNSVARGNIKYMPILIGFYIFASGHGVSVFNYNSIFFGWFIVWIGLWYTINRGNSLSSGEVRHVILRSSSKSKQTTSHTL